MQLMWRPLINQQSLTDTQNTKEDHESQKGFKNIFLHKIKNSSVIFGLKTRRN